MPQGLQVFDQFGNLKIDLGDRLLRFLGYPLIVNAGDSGSITNDGFLTGTPFWLANMFSNNGISYWPGESLIPPNVTISGNVLSYSINIGLGTQVIQYGVY